jgi:homoserine kinase
MGGFTLIPGSDLEIISLPVAENLTCIVLHPDIEVATKKARSVLPASVPLKTAVRQWGGIAAFVSALYDKEYEKLGRYMEDFIVEPARQSLIPGFGEVKKAALNAGAMACTISGAGPSMFALTTNPGLAVKIAKEMKDAFARSGLKSTAYVSNISPEGGRVIGPEE